MNPISTVLDFLDIVRSRIIRIAIAESVCIALSSITLLVVLSVLLAYGSEPSPLLLQGLFLLIFTAILGSCYYFGKQWWYSRRPEQVAIYVESRLPAFQNTLISSVEFGALPSDHPTLRGLSSNLIDHTIQSAGEMSSETDLESLVQRHRLRRLQKTLVGLVACSTLLVLLAPAMFQEGWARLTGTVPEATALLIPGAPHELVDSLVGDVEANYSYPAYTRLPPVTTRDGTGDLRGIPGTQVVWKGTTDRDVTSGHLQLEDGGDIPITVNAKREVTTQVILTQTTRYKIVLFNNEGMRFEESQSHAIDMIEDNHPVASVLSPEDDIEVNLEDQVVLVYQANDDYGLAMINLVYSIPGEEKPRTRRVERLDGERSYRGDAILDIAELNVQPGDTISVWIEALDENSVTGPNKGVSSTILVKIWSPKEKHEQLVDDLAKVVEAFIILLADRLEAPIAPSAALKYQAGIDAISAIHQKTSVTLELLETMVSRVQEDPLMPDEVRGNIASMLERHQALHLTESHLLRTAVAQWRIQTEHIQLLSTHNTDTITTFEKDILALDRLIDRLREDKLKEQTRDLLAQQDELIRLLEELKNSDSTELSEQAQSMVDQLQDQLDSMMNQLMKQAKNLPYENFNPGALDPEGTQNDISSFKDALDAIREKLAEGDIAGATELAENLQQQMTEMMAMMEQGFEGSSMAGGNTELQQEMLSLDQDLSEVVRDEKEIFRDTSDVSETLRNAMDNQSREQMDRFIQEELQKVEELRKNLSKVNPETLDQEGREQLDSAKDMARNLQDIIGEEDWKKGEEIAQEVASECNSMSSDVSRAAARAKNGRTAKNLENAKDNLKKSEQVAQEIIEDLQGLAPNPEDFMTPEEHKELETLAERQKKTNKKLMKIGENLKKSKSIPPNVEQAFSDLLKDVEQSMDNAEEQLQSKNPQKAGQHEEAALEKMGRARKKIQQMLKPQNTRMGLGPNLNTEDTDIPKPEDYAVPEAFRKEMMKAMKENAPRQYQERIKRYYEELVR